MPNNFAHFSVHRKAGRNRGPRKAPKKDGPCKKILRSERNRAKKQGHQSQITTAE